jgi:hypothetical protein
LSRTPPLTTIGPGRKPEGSAIADLAIAIEINGKDNFSGVLGGVQKGVGGLLGGFKELGLGIFGITQTFDVAKGAIEGLIGPAIEAEQVASQTAAVLKSTGEAAGLSADDISGYASSLSKLTPFEDEAIQSAENLLLTFTNIGKDVFPDATETVLNMSQALGQDLKSSSVQLGKALNDPIKGITALSRVGVSFTDEQKEQIKTLQESGDMMGAQKVILAELEKEFGGAAKAAGQTFGGQMVILQTAIGNVAEAIGGPLVKGLSSLATAALPAVQAFADELPAAIDGFMGQLSGLGDVLAPLITILTDGWQTVIQVFQGDWSASDSIDPVVNAIGLLATGINDLWTIAQDAFTGLAVIVDQALSGDVAGAFANFGDLLLNVGLRISDVLITWAAAFVNWIGPMIPPMLQELTKISISVATFLYTVALPTIVENLGQWAGAFVDWVAPLIPPLLGELGQVLIQLGSWLLTVALPSLAGNLLKWGIAFVEWVAPRIPLLIAEMVKLEIALGAWILTDALPAIVSKLLEWGKAFVDWVGTEVLPKLPGALAGILNSISEWATASLNSLAVSAGQIGQAIIDGVTGALSRGGEAVSNLLAKLAGDWIAAAKLALGISSPSEEFEYLGRMSVEGYLLGWTKNGGTITDVVRAVVEAAVANGIRPEHLLALAKAESGLNPRAHNTVGEDSVGLFQHNRAGGQGAGFSVEQLMDPRFSAQKFAADHAALYKQLVAEGLAGEALVQKWGKLAEVSEGDGSRYVTGLRQIIAEYGNLNLAAGAAGQGQAMLTSATQQGTDWAKVFADQQARLTEVMQGQADPMRNTKEAMAEFGSVLGPIERQVAGGQIALSGLQFKLVDLARATGLATKPWDDYSAGLIDIDQAMERVVNQASEAGPQFDALRVAQTVAGNDTQTTALNFLQAALNYQKAVPAIDATATATGTATQQTGEATDAVSQMAKKYDALKPAIDLSTEAVKLFQEAIGGLDIGKVDEQGGAWDSLKGHIDNAADAVRSYRNELDSLGGAGFDVHAQGGVAAYTGLHWLEQGERVLTVGQSARSSGSGGGDTINVTLNMPNYVGTMDQAVDAFEAGLARKRRRNGKLAWER